MSDFTANTNPAIELQTFNFRFKKDKLGNKRPSLEFKLPVPSVEGIIEILKKGGKGLELLQDSMYATIKSQASDIVGADEKISQETFPVAQIEWDFIANMPKAERQTIAAEQWEAFAADYSAVMPSITGKSADQVGLAVQIYLKKFVQVKTNKGILNKLKEQLALYMETNNAEQFQDVLDLLLRRVDTYLAAEEPVILAETL